MNENWSAVDLLFLNEGLTEYLPLDNSKLIIADEGRCGRPKSDTGA